MTDLEVITTRGTSMVVDEAGVQGFKTRLRGPLLCPSDTGYEEARQVWNAMIDRRPALIVRCAGVADVLQCVQFARAHDLLLSVRGGGHNIPGNAVCDHGLMIDLSRMRSVRVDPVRCTARAEGGVTWREFNHETQAFGLATTGGTVSDTGIAGLSLGGGLGWLAGKHGLVCDNLLSVDIVTADGRFLTASAAEHADLFWGVRGGGGNFGVVTAFEYQLHPVGPCLAGTVIYPFAQAKAVLQLYRDFTRAIPDELNTLCVLFTLPDGLPAVVIGVCYNGPREAGEVVLRPLRAFRPLLTDLIRPMAYTEVNTMFDAMGPPGRRNYVKTLLVKEITDDAIDTLVAHFATVPSPLTVAALQQVGNAARRIAAEETPFCHRDAQYEFFIHAIWLDPVEDEEHIRWTRALFERPPFQTGCSYINHMGRWVEEGGERIRAAFGPNYERLVALKHKYDPTNLFRHNQNIM